MYIPNAVGVASSALSKLFKFKLDIAYVYDNTPRSPEICEQIQRAIDADKKIVLFPDTFAHKDVGEAIECGISVSEIIDMLHKSCYSGLMAQLMFNNWKKC